MFSALSLYRTIGGFKVRSVWHFFHPSIIDLLFKWLREKGLWKDSLSNAPFILEYRITEFKEALNSKGNIDRASHINTVEQVMMWSR